VTLPELLLEFAQALNYSMNVIQNLYNAAQNILSKMKSSLVNEAI